MQGSLLKLQNVEGALFTSATWQQCFFILKNRILTITDEKDKSKTLGQMHMSVSKLLPEQVSDGDCDIRVHSGLVELRLRA